MRTNSDAELANLLVRRVIAGEPSEAVARVQTEQLRAEAAALVASDRYPHSMFLGWLRPGDRFSFVETVPRGAKLDLMKEYVIVPADRGYVAFSDGASPSIVVESLKAHSYPIKLHGGKARIEAKRFCLGDKVRNEITHEDGFVVGADRDGNLYSVEFVDSTTGAVRFEESLSGSSLVLLDKDETTRHYIQPDPETDRWKLVYYGHESAHPTQLAAVQKLYRDQRAMFYRWSRLAASEPQALGFRLTTRLILHLVRVDPKVWHTERALKNHNVYGESGSVSSAVDAMIKSVGSDGRNVSKDSA